MIIDKKRKKYEREREKERVRERGMEERASLINQNMNIILLMSTFSVSLRLAGN